jgi:hypothetical protein
LSLCLLCRTNDAWLAALGAGIAIGSKFVLRVRGKHLFNPTNLALVVLMLGTDGSVWVSPGQWGNVAFFAFLMACFGGLVVMRAGRADVALTFLAAWIVLLVGRSLWLHEPMTIPLHRLQNGALLLFAFFMISDPRTTPDSRTGRVVFAILVALGGWWWQFLMFGTNGLLWSLAACSLLTPLIDFLLPARRYEWSRPSSTPGTSTQPRLLMKTHALLLLAALALPVTASAFCGFYVARADSKLYNQSSQVALVRDGRSTSITMASDYQGDLKEFALVIPVPTLIDKEDVKVVEKALLDHLDAYTAPRLVEYWDPRSERGTTVLATCASHGSRRHPRIETQRRRSRPWRDYRAQLLSSANTTSSCSQRSKATACRSGSMKTATRCPRARSRCSTATSARA